MIPTQRPGPRSLSHDLRDHPLLTLDALAELAIDLRDRAGRFRTDAWPVEHHLGDLPEVLPGGHPPRAESVDLADMIRTISSNGCWVVLWNIERVPRYDRLLRAYLQRVQPVVTPSDPEQFHEGFVFISAPSSVTPVHIDPEHNALLQITGQKTLSTGALSDRGLWHREIERVLRGGDRHLPVKADDEQVFPLTPGTGVYVPPFAPHWVRNGPQTCVSLSVTWRTARAYRAERVHRFNSRVRRLGLNPLPPEEAPLRDTVKATSLRVASAIVRAGQRLHTTRRYDPSAPHRRAL